MQVIKWGLGLIVAFGTAASAATPKKENLSFPVVQAMYHAEQDNARRFQLVQLMARAQKDFPGDSYWQSLIETARHTESVTAREAVEWPELMARKTSVSNIERIVQEIAFADNLYSELSVGRYLLARGLNGGLVRENSPHDVAAAILKYEFSPIILQLVGMMELLPDSVEQQENLKEVFAIIVRKTLNSTLRAHVLDQTGILEANLYGEE